MSVLGRRLYRDFQKKVRFYLVLELDRLSNVPCQAQDSLATSSQQPHSVIDYVSESSLLHVGDAVRQRSPLLHAVTHKERRWPVNEIGTRELVVVFPPTESCQKESVNGVVPDVSNGRYATARPLPSFDDKRTNVKNWRVGTDVFKGAV